MSAVRFVLPTDEPGVVPQEAERGYFGDVAAEDTDRLWRKVFRADELILVLHNAHDGGPASFCRDIHGSAVDQPSQHAQFRVCPGGACNVTAGVQSP